MKKLKRREGKFLEFWGNTVEAGTSNSKIKVGWKLIDVSDIHNNDGMSDAPLSEVEVPGKRTLKIVDHRFRALPQRLVQGKTQIRLLRGMQSSFP